MSILTRLYSRKNQRPPCKFELNSISPVSFCIFEMASDRPLWTKSITKNLQSFLPLQSQKQQIWKTKGCRFEYQLGTIVINEDELYGVVHMRAIDRRGGITHIERGGDVVSEISKHTNQEFRPFNHAFWRNSFVGNDPIETKAQVYSCAVQGCKAFIRTVCWKPFSPLRKRPTKTDHRKCFECGNSGHRISCCCISIGICRMNFDFRHDHSADDDKESSESVPEDDKIKE